MLTACSSNSDSSGATASLTVAITTPSWSAGLAPFAVAEKEGYFKAEGLKVKYVLTAGGAAALTQVGAGTAQIGTISTEPMAIGASKDPKFGLQSFYNYGRRSIFAVQTTGRSGITTIAGLKGKRVGVPSLAAVGVNVLQATLQTAGLTVKDVTLIAIGAGQQAVTAVQTGRVDAVASDEVMFSQLKNAGIPMVNLTTAGTASLLSLGMVAEKSDIAKRSDVYGKFGRAISKATLFSVTNPEAAIRILWKAYPETKPSGMSDDTAMEQALVILRARLERTSLESPTAKWGEFPAGAYAKSIAFATSTGLIKTAVDPEKLYTNSLVSAFNDFDAAAVQKQAQSYAD